MVLASILMIALVYSLEFSSGRPSLMEANLFGGGSFSAIYTDAYWTPPAELSWLDYGRAMMMKAMRNTRALLDNIRSRFISFEILTLTITGLMTLGLITRSVCLKKWDAFMVGVLIMLAAILVLVFTLYTVHLYRGLRNLMFVVPFLIIGVATVPYQKRVHKYLGGVACVFILWFSALSLNEVSADFHRSASLDKRLIHLFGLIGHDDQKMLVADFRIALPYISRHDTKWSFLPANEKTLKALVASYSIGTFVIPGRRNNQGFAKALDRAGFQYKGSLPLKPPISGVARLDIYQ